MITIVKFTPEMIYNSWLFLYLMADGSIYYINMANMVELP